MTKADLIEKKPRDAGITKAVVGNALDSFIDVVKKALKKGSKVTLVDFGTFSVSNLLAEFHGLARGYLRGKAMEGRYP